MKPYTITLSSVIHEAIILEGTREILELFKAAKQTKRTRLLIERCEEILVQIKP